MTVNRNKKQDIKITDEHILNKQNITRKEQSWLDHTQGGAELDYDLLRGATVEEMMASSGRTEGAVLGHVRHLDVEHGLIVSEKDDIYRLEPSRLKGTLNKKNEDLFEAVQLEHINKAVKDFEIKGAPKGLGSSTFYDVIIEKHIYPPKPVMAYANFHATGRKPGNYFSGGVNTPCFRAYERVGIEIVKKNKTNMSLLDTYLQEFADIADDWFKKQSWLQERYDFFQEFFTEENLEKAEWSDFQELGNNIHAFANLALAKQRALGRMNLSIEDYRNNFSYLISEKDSIDATINNLLPQSDSGFELPFFGKSSISELVAYAFPGQYVTYNARDIDALEILGLKLPKVRGEKFGEFFLRYNKFLQPILESYKSIVSQRTETTVPLELDQFFSWLYETKRSDKPLKNLIDTYKKHIQESELKDELYKWQIINDFKGKPNLEVDDFQVEIKSLKFGNLVYAMSRAVVNHLAKEKPEELRKEFKHLFNDDVDLEKRIANWEQQIKKLYKSIGETLGHHQDERSLSVYLTLHDPAKYTLFKSSYYNKFCDLLGIKHKKKGQKYVHYLKLLQDFVDDYVSHDKELIDLVDSFLPESYESENLLLIAQDILYQVLDKNAEEKFVDVLKKFIKQAGTSNLKKVGYPDSYKDLEVKVSFGTGGVAKIPWIAFLLEPHVVTNGIYPVFLYFKEKQKLILSYGLSETNDSGHSWPGEAELRTIEDWFLETYGQKPFRYGASYIKGIYDVNQELNKELIQKDLNEIIDLYKNLNFQDGIIQEPVSTYQKEELPIVMKPINQILFGPPGTGKTYKLKNEYFKKYTSKETSITSEKNFENVVKNLSWWQVIALALLELKRAKVNDIIQNRWIVQKSKFSEASNIRPIMWSQLQSHSVLESDQVNVKSRQAPLIFDKTEESYWEIQEEEVKELAPELYEILDAADNFSPRADKEINRYKFTTFHQSFAYEDFIEGIKPIITDLQEEADDLAYEIQNGVFKELCIEAQNDPENRYAIFIDEINRGNVSNIFGELITLIEPDKRTGASNGMSALLPYSKKRFSVPLNVDIYGTMNTADRSVEALDTALRRRFSFQEIMPNPDKITAVVEGISLRDVLMTINERIEVLIDRDHTIGHSYFMGVDSLDELKLVFKDKIIPLLQEYFYGDYGKIGLVLGDGFVELQKKKENLFANFQYERKDELNNDFYKLKLIGDDFSIIEAVNDLLYSEDSQV